MISVIIPTFNRADMLAKVIPSYLKFAEVGELLIVDDGSSDNTPETVAAFAAVDGRIRLIRHPVNRGMTFARNTGIQASTGDLVLFSEDDLALAPGSLATLAAHMTAHGADIIAGRRIWMRIGESQPEALARANRRHWPVVNRRLLEHNSHAVTEDDVPALLVNATMLVRREVLEAVPYADCYPGNGWREESDFQLSAQAAGFKVVFCPHALAYHYDRSKAGRGSSRLTADLIYLHWMGRNNLTFLRRHRDFLHREVPEALLLNSPWLTNFVYMLYRGALLAQTEVRRAILSRGLKRREAGP